MNKTELIAVVAEKTGITKKDADVVVNTMLYGVTLRICSIELEREDSLPLAVFIGFSLLCNGGDVFLVALLPVGILVYLGSLFARNEEATEHSNE